MQPEDSPKKEHFSILSASGVNNPPSNPILQMTANSSFSKLIPKSKLGRKVSSPKRMLSNGKTEGERRPKEENGI